MDQTTLADAFFTARRTKDTLPLITLPPKPDRAWLRGLPDRHARWLRSQGAGLDGAGLVLPVPGEDGALEAVYFSPTSHAGDSWRLAHLPAKLPPGRYALDDEAGLNRSAATQACFGWALSQCPDRRYKSDGADREAATGRRATGSQGDAPAVLVWPKAADRVEASAWLDGVVMARQLVNTPAEDMGPAQLAEAAKALAEQHGGRFEQVVGDAMLAEGFPAAHAVGRGATPERAPRILTLRFRGSRSAPTVALVGKGVVFDTGGLDIKPRSSMRNMKKDMGGAAVALGLARTLLALGVDLNLLVVIGAVENAVSAGSFRPGDVLQTRKGLTVEVGDTDAEGRLVLSDCLTYAGEQDTDLILDFATLTGSARVALGPDLPPVMARDNGLSTAMAQAGHEVGDPLWPMPLYLPYAQHLRSNIADLCNITEGFGFAGSITAGLFLEKFVPKGTAWAHFDLFCWNPSSRPGRPAGGEAHALRAMAGFLRKWKPDRRS
jgi:leucyl aminopeptidase